MDEDRIRQIIGTLEEIAGPHTGRTRLIKCKPPDIALLRGNRAGLLKIACSILRASLEPIPPDGCRSEAVQVDLNVVQLTEDNSEQYLGFVQRMETWPEPEEIVKEQRRKARRRDLPALLGCGTIAFVVLFFFLVGVAAMVRAVFVH